MTKEFSGSINLDIRDSVPDWEPYKEPQAAPDSPNILYIVIDDTGFGAWEMYGGLIKMPNLQRIADKGLVYTNFHTTALCSPTRSSLLNGRNANSNGMACIEEATSGFPGSNGRIPFENALIAEVLAERGYNTYAIGKWHLLPEEEANLAANKRNWPLGRGFERYYGFLGGETDQWYPDLVYDNHLIEPPYPPDMEDTENGYHLSKDLVDQAISFIQDGKAIAPDKPWLLYFSPGANHAPHQIWPQLIGEDYNTGEMQDGKYPKDSSAFHEGYEQYRETVFAEMKRRGIIPRDITDPTQINPHGEGVPGGEATTLYDENGVINAPGKPYDGKRWPQTEYVIPWEGYEGESEIEKSQRQELFVRMAETYAAFSTYTDKQIGRLLDFLEETGQMDNTIIIAVADNGASAEGGPNGSINENLFFNDIPDDLATNYANIGKIGTLETYNHYPSGWAWAFDTPFKYWKRWASYEGGAATPFMICGPGIDRADRDSGYRKQYIHAIDLVPTLYDCLGLEPPEAVKGYTQNPIEGISFKYTFHNAYDGDRFATPYRDLPSHDLGDRIPIPERVKETQFYAMLGTRGIWHHGWHASTFHPPTPSDWGDFHTDVWELYCMDGDQLLLANGNFHYITADPIQSTNLMGDDYLNTVDPAIRAEVGAQLNEILERLKSKWFSEAGRYNGMPLDDRSTSAVLGEERPQLAPPPDFNDSGEFTYTYYPGGSEIPEAVAPNIRKRSYAITAYVDFPHLRDATPLKQGRSTKTLPSAPKGVLFSHGGRFGGHSLYIHDNQLCYVYNWLGQRQQKISCPLPPDLVGDQGVALKVEFIKSAVQGNEAGLDSDKFGSSTLGEVQLSINGTVRQDAVWALKDGENWSGWSQPWDGPSQFVTQPAKFSLCGEGLNIGRDNGQPVSQDYGSPSECKGASINRVEIMIKDDAAEPNPELEFRGMLWRD